MKIVSLEPFITEVLCSLGLEEDLVGISHRCDYPEEIMSRPRVTTDRDLQVAKNINNDTLSCSLAHDRVMLDVIKALQPDILLTALFPSSEDEAEAKNFIKTKEVEISQYLGKEVSFCSYNPTRLEEIWATFEKLGRNLGVSQKGTQLALRSKAQLMDWGDSFYERMKNKRVTFLSSIKPFCLGGLWIPDMIHLSSCVSQEGFGGKPSREVSWDEILNFKPDVIIVAPEDMGLQECIRTFKVLEKLPHWEEIPAVKRGEVCFAEGSEFHRPGPRIVDAMAIMISAISGLESGYITKRDSFYRLRWLELHRHKI